MNIGDRDSSEYSNYKNKVLTRKDPLELKKKKELGESTKHVKRPPADPPSEEWFGKVSGTPHSEHMKKCWEEFDRRENIRRQAVSKLLPHCPFCFSTDLTKISSVGKALSISLFGICGAENLGKTYKCNNCGGKF